MVKKALRGTWAVCVCLTVLAASVEVMAQWSVPRPPMALRVARPVGSSSPFSGAPIPLPGTFRAADFDAGGQLVAYYDTTSGNSGGAYRSTDVDIEASSLGGHNVGWTAAGEWLAYTVQVSESTRYRLRLQVASPSGGARLRVVVGATRSGELVVPATGGWQNWTTVSTEEDLTAGRQLLKLEFLSGGFNIAGVTVEAAVEASAPPVPPPPPPPPPPAPDPGVAGEIRVPAGGNLQAAIDAAKPGDTIFLEAGATFVGNFVLPVKNGTTHVTIRSAAPDSVLPPAGERMTPAYAPHLPKLKSPNSQPALATAPGAHHYRVMFVEFPPTHQGFYDIITLGDGSSAQNTLASVPYELVLDRIYVHGDPVYGQKRGVALNSGSTTIINSYVAGIRTVGQDSQAVGGWNGPGPFTIENNYLEAASENILFGGSDPAIPNLIPSDISIRRNHLAKPLAWKSESQWNVKNLLELKNAQRVVIDGNLLEHNWAAAQTGYAVLFTPRNQDGGAPWTVVQDVTFTNNVVRRVASGVNILGRDNNHPSELTNSIVVRNNVFEISSAEFGGQGRWIQITGGRNITFDHNTVIQDGWVVVAVSQTVENFVFTNNIAPDYSWAIIGDSTAPGNETIARYFPGSTFLGNVLAGAKAWQYPAGNHYPPSLADVGFVNLSGGDYRLSAVSPYRGAATDGKDIGAEIK